MRKYSFLSTCINSVHDCDSSFFVYAGGQAERSDQGCWSLCGAFLAKSVC